MKPLLQLPGVVGYMVINEVGIPVKWSQNGFDANTGALGAQEALSGMEGETEPPTASTIPASVTHYASLVSQLVQKSQHSCRKLFGRSQGHHNSGMESMSEVRKLSNPHKSEKNDCQHCFVSCLLLHRNRIHFYSVYDYGQGKEN